MPATVVKLHDARRMLRRADQRLLAEQRRVRTSILWFLAHSSVPNALTAPLVYSLIVPFALLDLWTTLYQWVCFPIYGVARVRRGAYFVLDRQTLGYLNAIERVHCTYCSYANGVVAYVREVAARTEAYWCPIRHGRPIRDPHAHYRGFVPFGDGRGYHARLPGLRRRLRHLPAAPRRRRHQAPASRSSRPTR